MNQNVYHLDDQIYELKTILESVLGGRSDSVLVYGCRGTGKTTMINYVLELFRTRISLVKLSGMIHTTERLALQSVLDQLREQKLIRKRISKPLITHLDKLIERSNSAMVFVLDEIDMFASHPRQSLLYNLLDNIGNIRRMCVIGVTARSDFVELLEKRIRSRLSGRRITVYQPKCVCKFEDIVKNMVKFVEKSEELFKNNEINLILRRDLEIHLNPRYVVQKILSRLQEYPAIKYPDELSIDGLSKVERDILSSTSSCGAEFTFEDVYQRYRLTTKQDLGNYKISRTLLIRAYEALLSNGFIRYLESTQNIPLCFRPCKLAYIPSRH